LKATLGAYFMGKRFNPYFNGIPFGRVFVFRFEISKVSSFNPYFNGIPFGSIWSTFHSRLFNKVSILILMEYLSEDLETYHRALRKIASFNPYFNGIPFGSTDIIGNIIKGLEFQSLF